MRNFHNCDCGSWCSFLCRLLILVISAGCSDAPPARSTATIRHPSLSFSKSWEAPLGFPDSVIAVAAKIGDRIVASATISDGVLHTISFDNGVSWSAPVHVNLCERPLLPFASHGNALWYLSQRTVRDGGQTYVHAPTAHGWNAAAPLRDTEWGHAGGFRFAFDSLGGAYVVFSDSRDGTMDVYFSFSSDFGKTWSSNIRLNDDRTGQEEHEPFIASSPAGALCVVWSANRDAETLFDIYCAISSDRGITWSRNVKVNDDSTRTWQGSPVVVHHQQKFSAVWMDYRRGMEDGNPQSAIYYSSSTDGTTWSRNTLLSENRFGNCTYPTLQSDGEAVLECMWMDAGENILGDIFYAHSLDGGVSWSLPAKVNDDSTASRHYHRGIGALGDVVGWLDSRDGTPRVRLAKKLSSSKQQPAGGLSARTPQTPAVPAGMSYRILKPLLREDFATDPSSRWRVLAGTWIWKNGAYIGYGTQANSTVAGDEAWSDYEFKGQFKLDDIDHREAHLFVRLSERGGLRYYRIANLFRSGIRLDYYDGRVFSPLAEVSYPIQRDRWYSFNAVVKEGTLNYSVNDTLRLSFGGLVQLRRGKIGVGSQTTPTYFKGIVVNAVE